MKIMEKKRVFVFFFIMSIGVIAAQEQKFGQYFGTGYNTIINADRVNVLSHPSLSGDLLFQVNKNARVLIIGVSKEQSFIDNHYGNWLKIMVNENHHYREGWVFGKYVDYLNDIVPSEIKILELLPQRRRARPKVNRFISSQWDRKNYYVLSA
ncbi:MAG: SH3 domain-containing protein [Treponema sp.]|jgi:hypothetical protein|nr:SH3 domain-containing protein [Treponema sp.]